MYISLLLVEVLELKGLFVITDGYKIKERF